MTTLELHKKLQSLGYTLTMDNFFDYLIYFEGVPIATVSYIYVASIGFFNEEVLPDEKRIELFKILSEYALTPNDER